MQLPKVAKSIPSYVKVNEMDQLLAQLEKVIDEIAVLDQKLEELKAPWTPGRIPVLD